MQHTTDSAAREAPKAGPVATVTTRLRRRAAGVRLQVLPDAERQRLERLVDATPSLSGMSLRDALALVQKRAGLEITGGPDSPTTRTLELQAALATASPDDTLRRLASLEAEVRSLRATTTGHLRLLGHALGLPELPEGARRVVIWTEQPDMPPSRIVLDAPADLYVPRTLATDGLRDYEPTTVATTLAALAVTDGGFLDIDANVGVFGLVIATLFPDRPVVAFEPSAMLADVMREAVRSNGLAIDVETVALAERDGTATLYMSPTDTSNSLREGFRSAVGEEQVVVARLDSWLAAHPKVQPTVCKIDTESTEPDVLDGATAYVAEHRPWLVVEVLAGRTEARLQPWLEQVGYHAHIIGDDGPEPRTTIVGDDSYKHLNWLFTPEPLDDDFWSEYARYEDVLARSTTISPNT